MKQLLIITTMGFIALCLTSCLDMSNRLKVDIQTSDPNVKISRILGKDRGIGSITTEKELDKGVGCVILQLKEGYTTKRFFVIRFENPSESICKVEFHYYHKTNTIRAQIKTNSKKHYIRETKLNVSAYGALGVNFRPYKDPKEPIKGLCIADISLSNLEIDKHKASVNLFFHNEEDVVKKGPVPLPKYDIHGTITFLGWIHKREIEADHYFNL